MASGTVEANGVTTVGPTAASSIVGGTAKIQTPFNNAIVSSKGKK